MKEKSTSSYSKIVWIFIIGISIYYAFKVTNFKKEIRSNIISKDTAAVQTDHLINDHNSIDSVNNTFQNLEIKEIENFIYKKYNYEGNNYLIEISGEVGVWGESYLHVAKNGKQILKADFNLWQGNIQDFKIEDRFCYFAVPTAGGTDGNLYIYYYCIDFVSESIHNIVYNCNESFYDCGFENIPEIENEEEVYDFMKANIRIPIKGDNYFTTSAKS